MSCISLVDFGTVFLHFSILKNQFGEGNGTHSSTLAWKIPWTEEPGRLQSMGVAKSRTRLSDFTFTLHFHGLEKEMATHSSVLAWSAPPLVGCRLWGRTESDTTEVT